MGIVCTIDEIKVTLSADEVEVLANDATLKVSSAGFKMEKGGAGLMKTLGDLCDAIGMITVPTALGPSGPPANMAKFTIIKSELSKYLS